MEVWKEAKLSEYFYLPDVCPVVVVAKTNYKLSGQLFTIDALCKELACYPALV
jgi:hypothetical protein